MPPLDVTLESLINSLDAELDEADVLTKVSEARQRARGLAELGDQLVDHYVTAARASGASWAQIGDAMGVSKQAAQQRKGAAMFERYTDRARHVVVLAQEEARKFGSSIEPAHIMLGVLGEEAGLGAKAVALLAGSVEAAREAVTATMTKGEKEVSGHIPFTEAGKQALTETLKMAQELGHNYIGTEHILLGVLALPEDPTVVALAEVGVTPQRAREAVVAALVGYQHRGRR
jgi:Clp amino terminal domain, pathogenicity island component